MLTSCEDNGSFIMYYVANPLAQGVGKAPAKPKHCIGYAKSNTILGPYKPQDHPFICSYGGIGTGSIDANLFMDNGNHCVVYKNGSSFDPEHRSRIYLQQVKSDGVTTVGSPVDLINSISKGDNDAEGPALVKNPDNGGYALFFNAGSYKKPDTTSNMLRHRTSKARISVKVPSCRLELIRESR